jgi:hypothetical protein
MARYCKPPTMMRYLVELSEERTSPTSAKSLSVVVMGVVANLHFNMPSRQRRSREYFFCISMSDLQATKIMKFLKILDSKI